MKTKNEIENLALLKSLYMIASPSGGEKKMRKFIKKYVRTIAPDAVVESDKAGNLYVTRGESETYPVCVSHMDEVHDRRHGLILTVGGGIIEGRNASDYQPEGIGADDKNGIWVCLQLLARFEVCKLAFFVSEERGCVGSCQCDMSFFDNARFVLQCDRKGSHDFVDNAAGVELSTEEWRNAIGLDDYGYAAHDGGMTDVMELKELGLKVCCANMSCGYYNPHSDEEVTVLAELQNTYNLCEHIFETMTDVYPHEYLEPVKSKTSSYWGWDFGHSFGSTHQKEEQLQLLADDMTCEIMESEENGTDFDLKNFFMERFLGREYSMLTSADYKSLYEELTGDPAYNVWKEDSKFNFNGKTL